MRVSPKDSSTSSMLDLACRRDYPNERVGVGKYELDVQDAFTTSQVYIGRKSYALIYIASLEEIISDNVKHEASFAEALLN